MNQEKQGVIAEKDKSALLVSWLTFWTLIIGGGWTAYEYMSQKQNDKIDATLKYISIYFSGALEKSFVKVEKSWFPKKEIDRAKINDYLLKINLKTKDNEFRKNFILSFVSKNRIESDLILLRTFYSFLDICVSKNICDTETICSHFENDIIDFNYHYRIFFKNLEDKKYSKKPLAKMDHLEYQCKKLRKNYN